ncbi:hypothetical protein SD81_017165 [Tolypothrix campylonemoides VB511288]|nr:hypothetical protein SD81_017165 [Tolypothrix campylonemoides VB511288]
MEVKKEYERAKNNLAKALENESAEHRADVLQFVLDWNIHPDEEFFVIFAAIGHLKILIEQAPEDIRQLFKSVLQELDEWSLLTTEKLQIDSQHIKVTESLAQSSKALGTALNSLDVTSHQLLEQLKSLPELLRLLKVVAESLPSTNLLFQKWMEVMEKERLAVRDNLSLMRRVENHLTYSEAHFRGTYVKVEKIEARLEEMSNQLNQLHNRSQNQQQNKLNLLGLLGKEGSALGGLNYKLLGVFGGILIAACSSTAFVTRIVFGVAPAPLPFSESEKIQYTREQAGYTNVKLQRVEKKLGTDPINRKK